MGNILCENWMGAILHHISYGFFTKKVILDTFKITNDISKINLKTQVGNIVLPYQGTTTGQIWALDHKLWVHGHNLVIWL